MVKKQLHPFDIKALFEAMNIQRLDRSLSWRQVAIEMWNQSEDLNRQRGGHPISGSTLNNMQKRGATTCQHALFMLRWLNRSPESFLAEDKSLPKRYALPSAASDTRLRWNLTSIYNALDKERQGHDLTWRLLANQLDCMPNQLTGIRIARYGIDMNLAMKIVQWLDRPAADFIYPAKW